MIEVTTKDGRTSVSATGSLMALTTDTAMILRGIWRNISEENATGGKLFAVMIEDIINNPKTSPFTHLEMPDAPEAEGIRIDFAELMRQMKEAQQGEMDRGGDRQILGDEGVRRDLAGDRRHVGPHVVQRGE
jgi:hypothetical protein